MKSCTAYYAFKKCHFFYQFMAVFYTIKLIFELQIVLFSLTFLVNYFHVTAILTDCSIRRSFMDVDLHNFWFLHYSSIITASLVVLKIDTGCNIDFSINLLEHFNIFPSNHLFFWPATVNQTSSCLIKQYKLSGRLRSPRTRCLL